MNVIIAILSVLFSYNNAFTNPITGFVNNYKGLMYTLALYKGLSYKPTTSKVHRARWTPSNRSIVLERELTLIEAERVNRLIKKEVSFALLRDGTIVKSNGDILSRKGKVVAKCTYLSLTKERVYKLTAC